VSENVKERGAGVGCDHFSGGGKLGYAETIRKPCIAMCVNSDRYSELRVI
jgi:hypothetical protein